MYQQLCNKQIIEILDGDVNVGQYLGQERSMPYLTGPQLCAISTNLGLTTDYSKDKLSRWMYLENLLKFCIQKNKVPELLSYLFSKKQFVKELSDLSTNDIDITYQFIVSEALKKINSILYFSDYELVKMDHQFLVKKINDSIKILSPAIKIIGRNYIKELSDRAFEDIENGYFDSALTKCRTLLEEVFCYVIEMSGEMPADKGNISELYNQVKKLYKMHTHKDHDVRINMLLSGLEKILSSISKMRNKASDSHGLGNKRINIEARHATLYLNSAIAMGEFIIDVYLHSNIENNS